MTTATISTTNNPAALAGWVKSKDPTTGRVYYANHSTRQTQWDPPNDWVEVIVVAEETSVSSSSCGGCGGCRAASSSCGGNVSAAAVTDAAVNGNDADREKNGNDDDDHGDIDAALSSLRLPQLTLEDPPPDILPPPSPLLPPQNPPITREGGDEMPEPKNEAPSSSTVNKDAASPTTTATPSGNNEQQQNIPLVQQIRHRPAAVRAAVPFLSTFETELYSGESSNIAISNNTNGGGVDENNNGGGNSKTMSSCRKIFQNERSCLGHRERIMGLDFSDCGRFLATAAADSTIRIWDVANNKNLLLTTLRQHDDKYECTRVAWASSQWGTSSQNHRRPPVPTPRSCGAAAVAAGSSTTTTGSKSLVNEKKKNGDFNYLLATGGADGVVYLWGCADPSNSSEWTVYETLDHATYSHFQAAAQQDDSDRPQVYSLQFVDHWKGCLPSSGALGDGDAKNISVLMTSSDDHVHLWEVDNTSLQKAAKSEDGGYTAAEHHSNNNNKLQLREIFSLRFGVMHSYGYGVSIGHVTGKGLVPNTTTDVARRNGGAVAAAAGSIGNLMNDKVFGGTDRNPQGLVFVFDACYCPANGLLGVALSDGSLRLIHGQHGVCLSILQLPGCLDAHLTSLDSSGRHLATSVASGHVITWGIEWQKEEAQQQQHRSKNPGVGSGSCDGAVSLHTTCHAVLEGGHERGRPLFGVKYCGTDDNLLLSWGIDGRLCLWDAHSEVEQAAAYLTTLLDKKDSDYPMFCVGISSPIRSAVDDDDDCDDAFCIAVGGGGSDGCGVVRGMPVYLYNVHRHSSTSVHVNQALKSKKVKTKPNNEIYSAQENDK